VIVVELLGALADELLLADRAPFDPGENRCAFPIFSEFSVQKNALSVERIIRPFRFAACHRVGCSLRFHVSASVRATKLD
jgi:hypothetical protein